MNVVIVESPAKAKTINKYLGRDYQVLASYGHVRDLPAKDGSVDPETDFAMKWSVDPKSQKRLNEIASAVKGSDKLILATDPDREGEAISWHVLEVLKKKGALKSTEIERVVFNAITKSAVLDAMANPRQIDVALVDAYLARRALDYLVGFTLSPVLWRKLPGARSAGRVQSVALRLVCDREAEIEAFRSQEYWNIVAKLKTGAGDTFDARLVSRGSEKLDKLSVSNAKDAHAIRDDLDSASFVVDSTESKPVKRNPYPPFTTSTLQQEASRKLGFSSSRTMQTAQKLYEGVAIDGETQGLITYMRTDGVQMAPEAISAIRGVIAKRYGDNYLPPSPRMYKTKAKNAQEAHEAIRPTDVTRHPDSVRRALDADMARLYELIWMRAVASQMQSAELERTTAEITAHGKETYGLRATGSVQRFDGFLVLYQEGRDDAEGDEESRRLPPLAAGDTPRKDAVEATQHFTEPPPRYTEASLIKRMEELGIGRPSTYTATLQVLQDRDYVTLEKKRLMPQDKGRLVIAFLESFFDRYVQYDFTAALEERLDRISAGEIDWKEVLREFWQEFSGDVEGIRELRVAQVIDALNDMLGEHLFPPREDGSDPRACPSCDGGRLSLKIGKFGSFIGCSNYPDCRYTRQIGAPEGDAQAAADDGVRELGTDPQSGLMVSARSGRFGPFVQLGEAEGKDKPKRSSIPKDFDAAAITLEQALQLLALPREIGPHPEDGEMIVAGIGRYGPFVNRGRTYANLESASEVFTVGLNRAVALIAEKEAKRGGRSAPGKALGTHGDLGTIELKDGRYGPYVTNGKVNATIPRGTDPAGIDLEQAAALISAKAASGGGKGKGKRAPRRTSAK
ncbi:MAG: type I DNA topoisomerase [Rhodobiaceae bacterium]|nr:type I DNA topoisomerase [Rhodobiaceae bacterium]MCC0041811.1 type I DNA topoisomerase [Rhodobiaceae bacterium]